MQRLKLITSCKGGITIFQCLIFMSLLILGGVIIDSARIITAEKKVQSVLNTAARSSLASYDKDIMGGYGIFALNTRNQQEEKTADNIFINYLERNLGKSDKMYSLVKYELDYENTYLSGSWSMLSTNPDPLREQILKYMKYKGPANVTDNVIDKLKNSGIFQKAEFAGEEKKVRSSWVNLDKCIKDINKKLEDFNSLLKRSEALQGKEYIETLKSIKEKLLEVEESAPSVEEGYMKYVQSKEKSDSLANDANKEPALRQEGAEIETHEGGYLNSVNESKNIINELKASSSKIDNLINLIEPMQARLDELIKQKAKLEEVNNNLFLVIVNLSGKGDINYINNIILSIQENNRAIGQLQEEINGLSTEIMNLRKNSGLNQVNKMSLEQNTQDTKEKPEGKISWSALENMKQHFESYINNKDILSEWLIQPEEFEQAKDSEQQKFKEVLLKDLSDKKVVNNEADADIAEVDSDGAIEFLKSLYDEVVCFFSEGGQASIEKTYIVEYIMDKFTYHTSQTERNHYFGKGEAEYILWGGTNQNSNIVKTVVSISVIRFAINTIDYFATSKVPEPVLRLVYSVGRGLVQSLADTYDMYSGKEISLCPSLKGKDITFGLNYEDHIRLFLLLQSVKDEKGQLDNVRQLIQVNIKQTGGREQFRLGEYDTKICAKATVKINLIFLPLLQLDKLGFKSIEGGYYIINSEAYMGY